MALPWTVSQAAAFAAACNPFQSWANDCGMFVAMAHGYDYSGWDTAADQGASLTLNGNQGTAPVGSIHFWAESSSWVAGAGHVAIDAGNNQIWSNDLQTVGQVHLSPRSAPITQWGLGYMGWAVPVASTFKQSGGTNPYWTPPTVTPPAPTPVAGSSSMAFQIATVTAATVPAGSSNPGHFLLGTYGTLHHIATTADVAAFTAAGLKTVSLSYAQWLLLKEGL